MAYYGCVKSVQSEEIELIAMDKCSCSSYIMRAVLLNEGSLSAERYYVIPDMIYSVRINER